MKTTLCFDYEMQIRYAKPTFGGSFTLRVLPQTTGAQEVDFVQKEFFPKCNVWSSGDSFGNVLLCGNFPEGMQAFRFHASGQVTTGLAEGEKLLSEQDAFKYRSAKSRLATPGEGIRELHDALESDPDLSPTLSVKRRAMRLMHLVHERMRYQKGVTGVSTSAEEALDLGAGVCEDFAHVMVALCKSFGITARYVTGFLLGEGESHAWVEVLDHDLWMGLDPTNDCEADRHIRVAVGRDVSDCPMNRGIHFGIAQHTMEVHVSVKKKEEEL
jgi:transglutaminase-like putative cysteine protease